MASLIPCNRWLTLFASMAVNVCIGSIYAWSVYQTPLMETLGGSTSDISLTFTIALCAHPLAMIIAGKLQDFIDPRHIILAGGLLFGAGISGAGFSESLMGLYLTYGLLAGLGIGMVYSCTVANSVRFFPDMRGLASGVAAAGFGSGAMLIAPLSTWMIEQGSAMATLKILGIFYGIFIAVGVLFIKTAPADYRPKGWTPSQPQEKLDAASPGEKNWRQMLKDPVFYALFFIYVAGTASGLMFIGHAAPIAQEVILATPAAAALAVSFMALANSLGRIFWGWVSDRAGRIATLLVMLVLEGIAMLAMTQISSYVPFVIALMMLALCFGGFLGCFPSIMADMFGAKNLGLNYGIVFVAFGVSAVIGPRLAARAKELHDGDYTAAFLIAASFSIVGIILTLSVKKGFRSKTAELTPP